jgi:hypothetical protein
MQKLSRSMKRLVVVGLPELAAVLPALVLAIPLVGTEEDRPGNTRHYDFAL